MTIQSRLEAAREHALQGGVPMRRTDAALYALLAECLSICEDVERDRNQDELRAAFMASGPRGGKNRTYVEARADTPIIVCRYVLEGNDTRNSTYRYALSLREAMRRQIKSADLTKWLKDHGGVNALYKTRPVVPKNRTTKTLHLTSPVTTPHDGWFTVTLRRNAVGFFDVKSPK